MEPVNPDLHVPQPPRPPTTTLPSIDDLCKLVSVVRPKAPPAAGAPPSVTSARKPWSLEDSIFAPRPLENDSKGWYDRDTIEVDVFERDWGRCTAKERFNRFLEKHTKCDPGAAALRAELHERYSGVLRVFDYYASLGAGDPFAMHIVAWGQLMMDTEVAGAWHNTVLFSLTLLFVVCLQCCCVSVHCDCAHFPLCCCHVHVCLPYACEVRMFQRSITT